MTVFKRGQELVLQRCSDVASRHLYGEALTTASIYHKFDIVDALLESNFEFDFEKMTNTLDSICAWGSERTLQTLLQHDTKGLLGVEQYSSGLSQAARVNNHQVVVYWLEDHPDHQNLVVDTEAVIDVSRNGSMDILPPLIEHIRPTDSFENTLSQCLQVASKYGHEQVVQYLIEEGADVNAVVDNCDSYHLFHGSIPKISALLFHGSIPKLSALQAALIRSQQRIVELLLRKGADPNQAEGSGRYPLDIAAAYCTVEIVQELISSGANAETTTEEHGTALQAAGRREIGGMPIIKTLLQANASVSSLDSGKAAALNEALSFFGTSGQIRKGINDRYNGYSKRPTSIAQVLSAGPGAVVMTLLANLPEEKADDTRYGLLAQMACIAGDQECVELLLQRGMDVNILGSYYGTALQAASRVGNIHTVDCLLKSGADVNILQGAHGTALRAAVIGGHEDLVRMLIVHGADINLHYENEGESVLHLALGSGNNAIFKLLLTAGADVNTDTNNQQHILIVACKHGNTALVELLLASGVEVSVSGTKNYGNGMPYNEATPLHAACANGHLSVVRLLLDHGADIKKINESSATPLIAAIRGNNLAAICLLLDAGADVNLAAGPTRLQAFDVTPLWEAAENCKFEIVEELLSAGAIIGSPSAKGNALARACGSRQHMVAELLLSNLSGNEHEAEVCGEALSAAMKCGDDEMVRLLLEHGVSPSFEMLRPACAAGVLEVVIKLIDTGIDIDWVDGDDASLLHVAASRLRSDIVQFLINRGTNVMLQSTKYGSPLIAALEGYLTPLLLSNSQPKTCRSLAKQLPLSELQCELYVEPGPNTLKGCFKDSPSFSQCEQIVRSLFDAGAEMDTTIRKFGNALHLASFMGSEVIVRQLLERMEDVNIFGGYFETALIAGLKGGHPIIVQLLLDRGIEVNQYSSEHGFALHCACAGGIIQLTRSLLDHGADVNAYDDRHGSALTAAISQVANLARFGGSSEQCAIVDLLLHHEPKVRIRECDLLAAVSWKDSSDGQHTMSLLFRHDPSAVATEAVIIKAIENYDCYNEEILPLVLEHDNGLGTTPAMAIAAEMPEVTKILLEHKPLDQEAADILEERSKRVALRRRR